MNQGHPRDAAATPEERWRRTVDRRDRAKLKVGRLLRDFGFEELTADAVEQIEGRLASVGVGVQPRLLNADASSVVTLEVTGPGPDEESSQPASDVATDAPQEADGQPADADGQPPEVDGKPDPSPRADEPRVGATPFPDAGSATDPLSRARAESARLLEERSQVERRLEAGSRQLKAAEQEVASLRDTLAATRREVQRAAAELQLALTGENEPGASSEQPRRD
jgi:hypothetical protein